MLRALSATALYDDPEPKFAIAIFHSAFIVSGSDARVFYTGIEVIHCGEYCRR